LFQRIYDIAIEITALGQHETRYAKLIHASPLSDRYRHFSNFATRSLQ